MLVPKLLMRMLVLPLYLMPNLLVLVLLGMKIFLIVKICRRRISPLEGLITVMHCKMPLAWRRCHPKMMIYFSRFLLAPRRRRRSYHPRIFFLHTLKAQPYWCPHKIFHRQTLKLEAYWCHHWNSRRQTLIVQVRSCK